MFTINLDENNSILWIKPNGSLTAEDFARATAALDPYLQQHDTLKGLMIETLKFPGWKDITAFSAHVKFIKDHHAKIQKIAIVTNSKFAEIGKSIIGPFVSPEIKHFPYGETEPAKQWLEQ